MKFMPIKKVDLIIFFPYIFLVAFKKKAQTPFSTQLLPASINNNKAFIEKSAQQQIYLQSYKVKHELILRKTLCMKLLLALYKQQ